MIVLVALILFGQQGNLHTSFYTFHKIGSYSVSDLYVNYRLYRYDVRFTLEKRHDDFGLKSISLEIDSLLGSNRLILGERPYSINSPLSTTLNLWGLTFLSRNADIFFGKTEDLTSSLPPTFLHNKYTIGAKIKKNITYRTPIEITMLRKHDDSLNIAINNSLGINTRTSYGDRILLGTQLWSCLSDSGFGSSFALNGRYVTQRLGGNFYFRRVFQNYVTPSNQLAQSGNWFQMHTYETPLEWIYFGQDISYSSLYNLGLGANTKMQKYPWPAFGYGINFSTRNEIFTQQLHTNWRYKKYSVTSNYSWSNTHRNLTIQMSQELHKFRFWSNVHLRRDDVTTLQFGGIYSFSHALQAKNYYNFSWDNNNTKNSIGAELSLRLGMRTTMHCTYERLHYTGASDHFVSLSMTNSLALDKTGLSFIGGRVFMDRNENGRFDNEDSVITDIEVILDGKQIANTDNAGRYLFSFITDGPHTVDLNLGCIPAEIGTENKRKTVTTRLLSKTEADFALGELGIIEGYVYYDSNHNGKRDGGEQGVPNVVLQMNGYITTTDKQGKYRFANLSPGTYLFEIKVIPPNTILIQPPVTQIHIKQAEKISNYNIMLVDKDRPVKKKVFGEDNIVELVQTYTKAAKSYTAAGKYTDALASWQNVLKLKPDSKEAKQAIADLNKKMIPPTKKEVKPVKKEVKPEKKLTREEIEKLFEKGTIYFIAERYDKALALFNQVLKHDPKHTGARDYKKRTEVRMKLLEE